MSEYGRPSSASEELPEGEVSVPLVVLSAALIGLGLFGTAYWLVTLNWLYFASLIPLILGAYLLFTRATGADHA
jgi:4-hydroxybenzoate polyprenyltransferase